ncbi:large neutral amino acids transporter small subunit 1-like isoform X4 [Varroa jacobsoni]|uniref:large neutral amino acids transporter small subunit 1-like isoform X4 n=1 Tax=Varroa jacobsoni TaxID=62625 RepID=UPI000BFA7D9A|nr:large neutral amino acids transporter small subunit 1-like isoform X4 [Varroa jacobsoni]
MPVTVSESFWRAKIGYCSQLDGTKRFAQHVPRSSSAMAFCLLTFINCYNVKLAMAVQDSLMFAKILALCLIIAIGGYEMIFLGNTVNLTDRLWEGTVYSPGSVCLAFYSGLFSYAGWNYLNFVTEELKNPFRNLPYGIYISLPIVTLVYLLANVAYFIVLTTNEIRSASAVAVTFGERTLGSFAWIIPVAVALSTFGGLNGGIFASSRLFFVGARQGHLPEFISMINVSCCTPAPSLIFLCLLSLVYLGNTDVFVLINYTAFSEALFIMLSVGGLLWLRYKEPKLERPIKVNLILPVIFFLISIFLVVLPFFSQPSEALIGLAMTLSGLPVFYTTVFWRNKPKSYRNAISSATALIQKVLNTVPEKSD